VARELQRELDERVERGEAEATVGPIEDRPVDRRGLEKALARDAGVLERPDQRMDEQYGGAHVTVIVAGTGEGAAARTRGSRPSTSPRSSRCRSWPCSRRSRAVGSRSPDLRPATCTGRVVLWPLASATRRFSRTWR